jgi:hypothetical protein
MACAWRDGCRCGPLLFKHLRAGHIGHLRMRSSMPIRYWRPASDSSPHGTAPTRTSRSSLPLLATCRPIHRPSVSALQTADIAPRLMRGELQGAWAR